MKPLFIVIIAVLLFISCKQEQRPPIVIPPLQPKKMDTISSLTTKNDTLSSQIKQTIPPIKIKTTSNKKSNNSSGSKHAIPKKDQLNKPVKEAPVSTNKNDHQNNH